MPSSTCNIVVKLALTTLEPGISDQSSSGIVVSLMGQVNSFLPVETIEMDTLITKRISISKEEYLKVRPKARIFGEGTYEDTKGNQFPVLFTVPGQGSLGDLCDITKGFITCETDPSHSWPYRPHHCNNITCPADAPKVSSRSGRRVHEKMVKQSISARSQGVYFGKLKHFFISPKSGLFKLENWTSPEAFQEGTDPYACNYQGFRMICDQILKTASKDGFYGGILIIHPTRWKPVSIPLERWDPDDPENEDPKFFRGENVAKELVFSPHAHFIGYGYFNNEVVPEDWQLWNISAEDTEERNWVRTISYVLSHQQVLMTAEKGPFGLIITKSKGLSYSWVGALSTAHGGKVPGSKVVHEVNCTCPHCRKREIVSNLHLVDDQGEDLGIKTAKVATWEYTWRPKGEGGRKPGGSKKKGFSEYIKKAPKVFDFKKSMNRVPWSPGVVTEGPEELPLTIPPVSLDVSPLREASRRYHELGRFLEGWILIDESDDPDPGGVYDG